MKKLIFTFALCLLIQGCASTPTMPTPTPTMSTPVTMKLVPQVLSGQKIIIQENSDAIISHKKSSVALRPPPDGYSLEGRPMILVSVYGIGKPFDFSTEDIQVFVDGKPHGLCTSDAMAEEIKQREANEIAAVESRYDALSRNAAEGAAYKSSSDPEVYSPSDDVELPGGTTQYGYKYDVYSLARDQSQINADKETEEEAIKMRTEQALATLDAVMLSKTTVSPDTWHRGYVAVDNIPDPARPHEIKIIVTVAGEEHEFLFNQMKI